MTIPAVPHETDTLVDRRRLRRRLTFWRVMAVLLAAVAVVAFVAARGAGGPGGSGPQIARVEISGLITDNRQQLAMLRKIAKAKHVRGLLVHVNSPGGTTAGGEALFEALREVAEAKPTAAVFGTMATSAAYIAGLATDHIVARGNTITGSVGVIFQWADVSQLLDKVGVKVNEVKSGNLKAVPSMFAPLDEQGRKLADEMVAESQRWFLGLVSSRRKIDPASVTGLPQGRIYSGRQALEFKLVDAIGGEREAVKWMEEARGVAKDLKVVDWKPRRDSDWGVLGMLGGAAQFLLGEEQAQWLSSLVERGRLASLPLDGMVSVWHGGAN